MNQVGGRHVPFANPDQTCARAAAVGRVGEALKREIAGLGLGGPPQVYGDLSRLFALDFAELDEAAALLQAASA
ncbi:MULTISPECIES: hypothetical protein [unclassified Leisingera]|uniref:hypothetical protein n=1 Tax=unclassified Leisingera TaxID=2614906 RepID=UPI0010106D16|nr:MULTISPECIES: hypothetical protein [unclassified Leisingera]MCF6433663.1 hypothetical protein [Leisingera sp. MMG026]QAX28787.1 hypothetical protein ETW24_05090 [Leisingera sp. NJS204]